PSMLITSARRFRESAYAFCTKYVPPNAMAASNKPHARHSNGIRHDSLTPIPQERLTSHPHAQQNAFRPRGARLQPRSFACWNQWLRHSPNSTGYTSTFQEGYLVDLGLKSRSQKLGGGVGRLRRVRRVFFCCVVGVRVLTTDIVGEAAGAVVVVSNAAGVVEIVGNAEDVGEVVGNAAGVGGITAAICVPSVAAADKWWGFGLFAIPNTIATTAEKIPTIPT